MITSSYIYSVRSLPFRFSNAHFPFCFPAPVFSETVSYTHLDVYKRQLRQSAEAVLIPVSLQTSGLSISESLSLYGILTGMSLSFLMFPNAVTSSLSAMLLPAISEEQSHGNEQRISLSIEYTILFGLLMGIFCMGIFLFFGNELGTVVFHEPLALSLIHI